MVVYSQNTDEIMNQIEGEVEKGEEEYLLIERNFNTRGRTNSERGRRRKIAKKI